MRENEPLKSSYIFASKEQTIVKLKPRRRFVPRRKHPNVFVPVLIKAVGFPEKYFNVHSFLSSLYTQVAAAVILCLLLPAGILWGKSSTRPLRLSSQRGVTETPHAGPKNNYNEERELKHILLLLYAENGSLCSYSVLKPAETHLEHKALMFRCDMVSLRRCFVGEPISSSTSWPMLGKWESKLNRGLMPKPAVSWLFFSAFRGLFSFFSSS